MPPDADAAELRDYLLGTLAPDRAEALEARYIADEDLFDAVGAMEQDLIEAYLEDRMAAADRQRFEAHYLASPVHRRRVETARLLQARSAARAPADARAGTVVPMTARRRPSRAWFGPWFPALAAAAALVLAALLWFARVPDAPQQARLPAPPADATPAPPPRPDASTPATTAPPGPARQAEPPAPPLRPNPEPRAPLVVAIALSPGVTRGDRQQATPLPDAAAQLLLELAGRADPGDRQFGVEIRTVDDEVVWRGAAAAAPADSGLLARVRVPAATLEADDYIVAVFSGSGNARIERGRYVLRLVPR